MTRVVRWRGARDAQQAAAKAARPPALPCHESPCKQHKHAQTQPARAVRRAAAHLAKEADEPELRRRQARARRVAGRRALAPRRRVGLALSQQLGRDAFAERKGEGEGARRVGEVRQMHRQLQQQHALGGTPGGNVGLCLGEQATGGVARRAGGMGRRASASGRPWRARRQRHRQAPGAEGTGIRVQAWLRYGCPHEAGPVRTLSCAWKLSSSCWCCPMSVARMHVPTSSRACWGCGTAGVYGLVLQLPEARAARLLLCSGCWQAPHAPQSLPPPPGRPSATPRGRAAHLCALLGRQPRKQAALVSNAQRHRAVHLLVDRAAGDGVGACMHACGWAARCRQFACGRAQGLARECTHGKSARAHSRAALFALGALAPKDARGARARLCCRSPAAILLRQLRLGPDQEVVRQPRVRRVVRRGRRQRAQPVQLADRRAAPAGRAQRRVGARQD